MYQTLAAARHRIQEEGVDTLKVFAAIPDSALSQAVTPAHRDLARLAWHLVESLISLPAQIGVQVEGPSLGSSGLFEGQAPRTMAEITAAYEKALASLLAALEGWTDADLQREDELYGMTWKRGYTLEALLVHQVHHRGQMTVLLRQAGLSVPEIYGPTLEGWANLGAPAPVV